MGSLVACTGRAVAADAPKRAKITLVSMLPSATGNLDPAGTPCTKCASRYASSVADILACTAYKFSKGRGRLELPCRTASRTPATDVDPAVEECTGAEADTARVGRPGAVPKRKLHAIFRPATD